MRLQLQLCIICRLNAASSSWWWLSLLQLQLCIICRHNAGTTQHRLSKPNACEPRSIPGNIPPAWKFVFSMGVSWKYDRQRFGVLQWNINSLLGGGDVPSLCSWKFQNTDCWLYLAGMSSGTGASDRFTNLLSNRTHTATNIPSIQLVLRALQTARHTLRYVPNELYEYCMTSHKSARFFVLAFHRRSSKEAPFEPVSNPKQLSSKPCQTGANIIIMLLLK